MKIEDFRHSLFTLLAIVALAPISLPGVMPTFCTTSECCGNRSDCSYAVETYASAGDGCCSTAADLPLSSGSDRGGTSSHCVNCACAGVCSSSACPSYADVGSVPDIPFLSAHFIPAHLNPSDFISEEPQPPQRLV